MRAWTIGEIALIGWQSSFNMFSSIAPLSVRVERRWGLSLSWMVFFSSRRQTGQPSESCATPNSRSIMRAENFMESSSTSRDTAFPGGHNVFSEVQMLFKKSIFVCFLLIFTVTPLLGQNAAPPGSAQPKLLNPNDAPPGSARYKLRSGDTIQLDFRLSPELNQAVLIDP